MGRFAVGGGIATSAWMSLCRRIIRGGRYGRSFARRVLVDVAPASAPQHAKGDFLLTHHDQRRPHTVQVTNAFFGMSSRQDLEVGPDGTGLFDDLARLERLRNGDIKPSGRSQVGELENGGVGRIA